MTFMNYLVHHQLSVFDNNTWIYIEEEGKHLNFQIRKKKIKEK